MTAIDNPRAPGFSRGDHRTLGLAALGGALEIYDFIIFVFFALTLSQLFFPPEMPEWLRLLQSFGIFVTGYLARPLGGILMAHFADHLGRKRVFSLSILMMALPCLLIGVMPTYADIGYAAPLILLALRILQGAAVGGEVPSAWTFVAEHAPAGRRGYALGFLQAGLTFGYLLGALTATLLAQLYTAQEILDYAWRYPFLLGGVFGVIGVWLRRWLSETPVFLALREQREQPVAFPLRSVLGEHRRALIPAALLTCVLTSAVVVLVVITPTVMQQRFGMTAGHTFCLEQRGDRLSQHWLRAGRVAGRPHRRLACIDDLQPGAAAGHRCVVRQPGRAVGHDLAGLRAGWAVLWGGGGGAVGDGRAVPGADPGVGDFVHLQHRLCPVGQYHTVGVDCADAVEPVGVCRLLSDHGHGRGADVVVFRAA